MVRLEALSEVDRKSATFFPAIENDDAPWTPMAKPLSQCRVALVTTAGLHLRTDRPFASLFDKRDISYRVIPSSTLPSDIVQSHASIGFDRTAIYRDLNITFPMDRMRELADRGVIGGLAGNYYSFMGAQRDATPIMEDTGPEVAQLLRAEGVDVVFLTPT